MKVATSQERLIELFDADPRNDTAIAEALGVSKQTVSMWRHGTRSPKKTVLLKICEVFGVSIEWLMGFDVDKAPNPKREFTIFVPSPKFVKMTTYMTQKDYENVVDAFQHAYERMKELGVSLDD